MKYLAGGTESMTVTVTVIWHHNLYFTSLGSETTVIWRHNHQLTFPHSHSHIENIDINHSDTMQWEMSYKSPRHGRDMY